MATVTLSQGYPKGTKAAAYVRASDSFTPSGSPVATSTVGDDGLVKLTGLTVGVQYWVNLDNAAGAFSVQAKDETFNEDALLHRDGPEATQRRLQADREAQAQARREAEKKDPLAASPAPGKTVVDNKAGRRSPLGEPQPGPRQDSTSGPQRSDTPDGTAHPKDPGEHVPDVPQEAVSASTPQRSSTETGVATVKDPKEELPTASQESVAAGRKQRSDTEQGEAEPKPAVTGSQVQKRDDSSANRARGRTAEKAEENVVPKAPVKNTTRTGTAKRAKKH